MSVGNVAYQYYSLSIYSEQNTLAQHLERIQNQ